MKVGRINQLVLGTFFINNRGLRLRFGVTYQAMVGSMEIQFAGNLSAQIYMNIVTIIIMINTYQSHDYRLTSGWYMIKVHNILTKSLIMKNKIKTSIQEKGKGFRDS